MPLPSTDAEPLDALAPLLHQTLDASPDAVAIYSAEERVIASTIVYANEALANLSGYDMDHFVGHSALLLAGARPDAKSMGSVLPPSGEPCWSGRVRKCRPDGTAYMAEVTVSPLRDARGQITHYLSRQLETADEEDASPSLPPPAPRPPPSRTKLLAVASTLARAREVAAPLAPLDPASIQITVATWQEALERLALADTFDLVVCDARSEDLDAFREQLKEMAPDALRSTFDLLVEPAEDSGIRRALGPRRLQPPTRAAR